MKRPADLVKRAIDPWCDLAVHPVMTDNGFGLCETVIDLRTGESEVCPHGIQFYWENFSSDAD